MVMKVTGHLLCALGLLSMISMADAVEMQDKIDHQFFDSLSPEVTSRMKRPFCNAFTGCGKKRSFYSENTVNNNEENIDRIRIPVPIYRAILRAASEEIRETLDRQSSADNVIPDVDIEYPTFLNQKLPNRERYQS